MTLSNALSSLYIDNCCRLERRKYYKHCRKARQESDKYMSIILDGMDQAKTNLPHFQQKTKQTSGSWKLKTHVTGAIVHGQGVYGYFDICEWPHSSNMTIAILLNILYMYKTASQRYSIYKWTIVGEKIKTIIYLPSVPYWLNWVSFVR